MKIVKRPCTPVQLIQTRSLLEKRAGYQTVIKENLSVTLPPGRQYDDVGILFAQGLSLEQALNLSLVSPAGIVEAGQGTIVVRDAADFGHRDGKIGEVLKEETNRGVRLTPEKELAQGLPHFRISFPSNEECQL